MRGQNRICRNLQWEFYFVDAEFATPPSITKINKNTKSKLNLKFRESGNRCLIADINDFPTGIWEPTESQLCLIEKYKLLTEEKSIADLKRKLHRIIYKSRDKIIKGAGEYPYPRMLFFHETSHQGTGQFHTHLIVEKLPASLNTQYEMEALFHKRLPHKVKALSKWKSIDIQRINQAEDDYRRISSYLCKQTNLELIALDPFNSDLSGRKK